MSSSTPSALPMQLLALTAMSSAPAKRTRTNAVLSAVTIAVLLLGALALAVLAWPLPDEDRSRRTKPESKARAAVEPKLVDEPQVPLLKIALPPPPIVTNKPQRPSLTPAAVPQSIGNPTPPAGFKPLSMQPKNPLAPAAETYTSLKPQPPARKSPRTTDPAPSAPPPVPADHSVPESAEQPVNAVAERQPKVDPPTNADGAEDVVTNVAATVAEGRALLRILEHGRGPSVEIAWPESNSQRRRLFALLSRCYGLQSGVVAGGETAFVLDPRTGVVSPLDLDRTSGFVRVVNGALTPREAAAFRRLRKNVAKPSASTPVRTFPRRFDALLLGGLQLVAGNAYANGATIRAKYEMDGGRLLVTGISIAGRNTVGAIDLTPSGRCTR